MTEGGREVGADKGTADRFAWLRRVDAAVYQAERAILIGFLVTIAGGMTLDVVYGRLVAQDSKIGKVLAKLGGVTDPATLALLDDHVAPWIGVVGGVLLVWFAFWTAQKHKGAPLLGIKQAPLVLTIATAAVVVGACWLMLTIESKYFYLLTYAIAAALYVTFLVRRKPARWQVQVGVALGGVTPLFVWFSLTWIPTGYTWSQEFSLLLLLWIGFLGASVCAHEGKHLRMESFDKLLPPRLARYVHAAGFVAAGTFACFLMVLGFQYVTGPAAATTSSQMQIPDRVSIVSVPIAFTVTTLRFGAAAISALLGGTYGRHTSETELAQSAAAEVVAGDGAAAGPEKSEASS